MKRRTKLVALSLLAVAVCSLVAFGAVGVVAEEQDAPQTRGLYTSISIRLDGDGNGNVSAIAKNEFTLGEARISVYVYLYRSDSFTEDHNEMVLAASGYVTDLDIFHSLSATSSTSGCQSYWLARVRYRMDNGGWREAFTETMLFDANGNEI